MDIFKDEMTPEIEKLQKKLQSGNLLTEEDMKLILLGLLNEEDSHESKQQ